MKKVDYIQCNIKYHIIWKTKYLQKILWGSIAQRCRKLIIQDCKSMKVKIIKGSIGKEYTYDSILSAQFISIKIGATT